MIDTKMRKNFQPLFDKMGDLFIKNKIKPNTITLMALGAGIIASLLIVIDQRMLALLFLWISGMLDVLDGTVARLSKEITKRGAYMDLVFDRMVEAVIILAFYFLLPENTLAYMLFFIAVIFNFTTFMIAGILFDNTSKKSMHYEVGIAERTETFIVFSLMMLFPTYIGYILYVFDCIILLTGVIRFYRILKYAKD